MKKVLITGVSGFLGSHAAIAALNKGYEVLGTIRNINDSDKVRKIIEKHTSHIDKLEIAEADLLDAFIWNDLMKGIGGVLHIASPFPRTLPKNDGELIKPAKEGTLNILEAAAKNKVKKVVITSSTASIAYGKHDLDIKQVYNEEDWTNEKNTNDTTPYYRSKTIAEKVAWSFMKNDISGLKLSVICPGAILGPVLEKDFGTSANLVIKLMDGSAPAIPKIGFEIVDVRDVAELHLLALTSDMANGKRFAATSSYLQLNEVAEILRKEFPYLRIPRVKLPNFLVRFMSIFISELKPALLELGPKRKISSQLAKEELDWNPRSAKEAVLACANSLVELKLVR